MCIRDSHITENPEPYEPVQSVQVTADETVLYTGDTLQAAAQVLPQEALVKRVKWSSSDPETAKVDQKGVITGITPGIAEITAESLISPDIKGTLTDVYKRQLMSYARGKKGTFRSHGVKECVW